MESRQRSTYIAFQMAVCRLLMPLATRAMSTTRPRLPERRPIVSAVAPRNISTATMTDHLSPLLLTGGLGQKDSEGLSRMPLPFGSTAHKSQHRLPFQPLAPLSDSCVATIVSRTVAPRPSRERTSESAVRAPGHPAVQFEHEIISRILQRGDVVTAMSHLASLVSRFALITTLLPPVRDQKLHRSRTLLFPSARDFARWAFQIRDLLLQSSQHSRSPLDLANWPQEDTCDPASTPPPPSSFWRPLWLPSHVAPETVPKEILCAFSLASLFDWCLALGYRPEEDMVAVLLACLSRVVPRADQYDEIVQLALDKLAPRRPSDSQDAGALPLTAIGAAIVGYGRLGQPGSGEHLLATRAHRYIREQGLAPIYHADSALPLNGWSSDVHTWCSLVRARCLDQDIGGAKRWFRLYRSTAVEGIDSQPGLPAHVRRSHASIYLTLMDGICKGSGDTVLSSGRLSEQQQAHVRNVLELVHRDGVEPSAAMLNFLVSFARRVDRDRFTRSRSDRVQQDPALPLRPVTSALALKAAQLILDQGHREDKWDSHVYRQAFDFVGDAAASTTAKILARGQSPTVRGLFASLVNDESRNAKAGHRRIDDGVNRWRRSTLMHPATLRSAFLAALRQSDWPLALVVLDEAVMRALGRQQMPPVGRIREESSSLLAQTAPSTFVSPSTSSSHWTWCLGNLEHDTASHWLHFIVDQAVDARLPNQRSYNDPAVVKAEAETLQPFVWAQATLRKAIIQEVQLAASCPNALHAVPWVQPLCARGASFSKDRRLEDVICNAVEAVRTETSLARD